MAELDFKIDDDGATPIAFTLHGTDLLGAEWSERFVCINPFPAGAVVDFYAATGFDDQGRRVGSVGRLHDLLASVLREEQVVETPGEAGGEPVLSVEPADDVIRFFALMHDKRRVVPYLTLLQLVNGILEEASGFPL